MSRTVEDFTATRITYETSLPVASVVARLDKELSKATAGPQVMLDMVSVARTKLEMEAAMHEANGGKDFSLFSAIPHHTWLRGWTGKLDTPEAHLYEFGNPLLAQALLQIDLRAAGHVPPRLLVLEKADRSGTQIIWTAPSTLIAAPVAGVVNEQLKIAGQRLDAKIERLVEAVIAV